MPKKIDFNQKEIVNTFRKLGCLVFITSDLGKGFPDLVIGFHGRVFLIEVKNGKLPPSQQKLTDSEKEFHGKWKDYVYIIRSTDEAINFVNFSTWKRKLYDGYPNRIKVEGIDQTP